MNFYPMYSCKFLAFTQYYSTSHTAIDIANTVTVGDSKGINEYAYIVCDNAKVTKNYKDSAYGYFVEYETTAPSGEKYIFASGHFAEKSPLVVGQTYSRGTIAGKIGSTGSSSAPHDHFRVSINGTRVDPLKYCYAYSDFNVIGTKETASIMVYNLVVEPTPEQVEIERLNIEISILKNDIIKLTEQNSLLVSEKENLTKQNEELNNKYNEVSFIYEMKEFFNK